MSDYKFQDRGWQPVRPGDCLWYEGNPWEFLHTEVNAEAIAGGLGTTLPVSARNMDTNEYHDVHWPARVSKDTVQFYTVALNPCENCKNQLRCVLRGEPRLLESGVGLEGLDLAT